MGRFRGLPLAEGVEGIVHGELPLELLVIVGGDGSKSACDGLEPIALGHLVRRGLRIRIGVVDDLPAMSSAGSLPQRSNDRMRVTNEQISPSARCWWVNSAPLAS